MKIKLQEIWRNRQHWDEELPRDLQQFVEHWTTNSAELKKNTNSSILQSAYRSANRTRRLLRCLNSGPRHSHFHSIRRQNSLPYEVHHGKTRVAQLKPQTNPKRTTRIRLQRASIRNTTLPISKITHWTDSTVVLYWTTTKTTERRRIRPTDYTKYDTLQLQMTENTYLQNTSSRRRNPRYQDNRTQTLAMTEWTSSQVAFTFMASDYRRNHTQHRKEYAGSRNRRHTTNLQHNLQYTAHLRVLRTILIVEKTTLNHLLHYEDTGSCQTTTIHSKRTISAD